MKRLVVFAHWDKDNLIDEYVIYYLKGLKKIAEKIIFVSDCDISKEELLKIEGIVDASLAQRHCEYDFGSYKRGFLYALGNNMLENFDQLIFANDSCYAPFFPFENMFEVMDNRNNDFWGVTKNHYGYKKSSQNWVVTEKVHLQSYFLVFNEQIFLSNEFLKFINKIKKEPTKEDIVANYECALTEYLSDLGFSYSAYAKDYDDSAVHLNFWQTLLEKDKSPFVKTSIFRFKNCSIAIPINWEEVLTNCSKYPIRIVKQDLKRNANKNKFELFLLILDFYRRKVIRIHLKLGVIYLFGKKYSLFKN